MHRTQRVPPLGAALCAAALATAPAAAVEFQAGGASASLDTTLSHGLSFRLSDPKVMPERVNSNDGDLNYERGIVSNTSRFVSELDVQSGGFGAFARVQGFVDFENRKGAGARTPLSAEARDRVGDDVEVLDLYVSGAFDLGDAPVDARIGNLVLNWGESTFIQGGVNVVNPFDAARLRKPGAELREGLLPVPVAAVAAAPTPNLSLEGFYQLKWAETRIDPSGTYFSTNDYATPGGERAFLYTDDLPVSDRGGAFNRLSPLAPAINADLAAAGLPGSFGLDFMSVPRAADRDARDSGQWGVAVRYYAEELADTEFGFYFVNHHSRLPLVSALYGTRQGLNNAAQAMATLPISTSRTYGAMAAQAAPLVREQVLAGFTANIAQEVEAAIPADTPNRAQLVQGRVAAQLAAPEIQAAIAERVDGEVQNRVLAQLREIAGAIATDLYGRTARYLVEYPEDLQVFGFSFNTVLGTSGWALQGEYSWRPDTPLQRAEDSMFREGLRPMFDALAAYVAGGQPTPETLAPLGTYLQGYVQRDVSQLQATATRAFGPALGADGAVFVAEAAVSHVHDMPDSKTLPLDTLGAGDDPADATSWGYRAAGRLDYNNAIGAVRLSPYAQFQHDVGGSSPGPGGQFVEGRTALTLGLGVGWLDSVRADLSYTMYGGGGNYLADRDFVAVSASCSF